MTAARRASWLVMALVVVAALAAGASGGSSPASDTERAHHIAAGIRCPTCRSQSVADSDSPAAAAIREDILRRVRDGQSDGQIRAYLVSRYNDEILLSPPSRGVGAAVWVLPVAAVAAALVVLLLAFRRWRPQRRHASATDRALVDEALREP